MNNCTSSFAYSLNCMRTEIFPPVPGHHIYYKWQVYTLFILAYKGQGDKMLRLRLQTYVCCTFDANKISLILWKNFSKEPNRRSRFFQGGTGYHISCYRSRTPRVCSILSLQGT